MKEAKPGALQIELWPIISNTVKYVQQNQHSLGHYELVVKAPGEKYGTKV